MRRLSSVLGEVAWSDQALRLARWLNPVVASPAAPLETFAAMDALGPSLMPRTSRLAGVSMGLSVLGARASAGAAERLTRVAAPADAPFGRQLAAREAAVQRWPLPQTTTLPATLATSYAVAAVGTGLTKGLSLIHI